MIVERCRIANIDDDRVRLPRLCRRFDACIRSGAHSSCTHGTLRDRSPARPGWFSQDEWKHPAPSGLKPPYTAVAFHADQFPLLRISRALTAQLSFLYCAIDVRSNGMSVSRTAKGFHRLGSIHARCEPGSRYTGRSHTDGFSIDRGGNKLQFQEFYYIPVTSQKFVSMGIPPMGGSAYAGLNRCRKVKYGDTSISAPECSEERRQ